jgi:glycerol uptake facilitator-like aquaporin
MKKYIAELIGTFALTAVVIGSLSGSFPVPTPVLAALTLGLFVYSVGHISGAHINPAVTIGIFSIGKIKFSDAIAYIVAQFIGAALAMWTIHLAFGANMVYYLTATDSMRVGLAELLGTFFFTFGIASVVYGHADSHMSGVVVGGSLLLGITLAALIGSNGVLNPAVAFGIGSFNLTYLLAPIIGSILGMNAYKKIA